MSLTLWVLRFTTRTSRTTTIRNKLTTTNASALVLLVLLVPALVLLVPALGLLVPALVLLGAFRFFGYSAALYYFVASVVCAFHFCVALSRFSVLVLRVCFLSDSEKK
jgi:hypothetical protein